MMRTFLKIILLLGAVFLVAGSMLYFVKTRLDPPTPMEDVNLHERKAWAFVESLEGLTNRTTLDNRFFAARQLVGFLGDNALIEPGVADQLKVGMVERFVQAYESHCFARFANSEWEERDIKEVAVQMNAVKGLKTSDGKAAVEKASANIGKKFDKMEKVVCMYDSAVVLARGGKYTGWANTKKRMERARRWAGNPYLAHNKNIVERLDSFILRLERSHYEHLKDIVGELGNYASKDKEEFDSLYDMTERELTRYADSAAVVYGFRSENVTPLRVEAQQYKAWAWSYYSVYRPAKDALEDVIDAGKSIIERINDF